MDKISHFSEHFLKNFFIFYVLHKKSGDILEEMNKRLSRAAKREALARIEDAARTQADFENVAQEWDKLDANRERRKRYYELPFSSVSEKSSELDERTYYSDTVIPPPLRHRLWRQLMSGFFIDYIFDCPYEIDELFS